MKRGKVLKWACLVITVLACAGVVVFLSLFGRVSDPTVYVQWDDAVLIADGQVQEDPALADPMKLLSPLPEGDFYRFSAQLGETDGNQLILDVTGAELVLRLDGEELYRGAAPGQGENITGISQVTVPLPNGPAGRTIELDYRPLGGDMGLSQPMPRVIDTVLSSQSDMAYANYYGIPAGILGMAFLLICFLFIVRLQLGKPDWSLPVLALAIASYLIRMLAQGFGTIFLPAPVWNVLSAKVLLWVTPILFILYLLLNRRLFFWKRLGRLTLCAAAAMLAAWAVSALRGGYLSTYLSYLIGEITEYGIYTNVLYWVALYLLAACALITAYGAVEALSAARADAKALSLKADLAEKSYHSLEERSRSNAALRHEMKNNITTLSLLYRKGDMQALGAYLEQLSQLQTNAAPVYFVQNFVVNSILQDAAARAGAAHIRFETQAVLPETLPIPEADLCSLLMNLLDNAIEAASRVPDGEDRFILFRCHLRNGFLAIYCENAYRGPLSVHPAGKWPQTTKADPENHGFGFRQMNAVAEKYHSLLDISYTDKVFTIQTALKLP